MTTRLAKDQRKSKKNFKKNQMIRSILSGFFGRKKLNVDSVTVTNGKYNREQRRSAFFVVGVRGGFVELASTDPLKFNIVKDYMDCSRFGYNNALKVADHHIAKNPTVYRIYKNKKGDIKLH